MKHEIPNRSSPGWPTALGLVVALAGAPALAAVSSGIVGDRSNLGLQVVLQLVFWSLALLLAVVVLRFERLPLASIGLRRPGWPTLGTAALLFSAGFVLQPFVVGPLVRAWGQQGADAGIAKLATFPAWFRVLLGTTGGVVEEMLYRGYAIERLITIMRSTWRGTTIAVLAFALSHIPEWGVGFALTADLFAGVVFAFFYLWRRDLVANMLAHSAGLIVAMFTIVPSAP